MFTFLALPPPLITLVGLTLSLFIFISPGLSSPDGSHSSSFISVLMELISGFQPLSIFFFVNHFSQPIVFLPYRWCTFSWNAQETIIFLFRTQKCSQQPLKQSELQRLLISIKATRWSCTGLWSQGWNSAARLTFHHRWAHYAVDLWASRLLLYF